MIPSGVVRAVQPAAAASIPPGQQQKPFDFAHNPYKAKRAWPPDFHKLSEKHQFRLERRYKRRSKLKWARPRLMVATKLTQWVGGIGVLVYGVLFMDWGDNGQKAFKGIRDWYHQGITDFFRSTQSQRQPTPRN